MSLSQTDNQLVIYSVKEYLKRHGSMNIPSRGFSMYPFLQHGDDAYFVSVSPDRLKIGDVVLYHSMTGKLIGHRLIDIIQTTDEAIYILKGDTNRYPDNPIRGDMVIGKLASIRRNGSNININQMVRRAWTWGIITIPVISLGLHAIVVRRGIWQHRISKISNRIKR